MTLLKTLIVEDEDLARERLASMVDAHASLSLVDACRNGHEASTALAANQVDILLLDIEMPGLNGIELSRKLRRDNPTTPIIVFVTAHGQFAIDAFDVRAVDFLLKPFDRERFDRAIGIAIDSHRARQAVLQREQIVALVNAEAAELPVAASRQVPDQAIGRLVVRHDGRMEILRADQVDWIQADGKSCVLHRGALKHRIEGPLIELVGRLDKTVFFQVSRFAVVNIDRVAELQEMFKGSLVAKMKNRDEVPISRRYKQPLMQRLSGL
jgi:two-component system LytT family response regulator